MGIMMQKGPKLERSPRESLLIGRDVTNTAKAGNYRRKAGKLDKLSMVLCPKKNEMLKKRKLHF